MIHAAENLFEAFNKLNILIVGDVMIDRYLTGAIDRISPEAPVPVVHLHNTENRLGGAANVALNIKAMGATPYLCSVIGKDESGATFLDLLPENELICLGITQSNQRTTTVKTRVIAQNQHVLRVDSENTHEVNDSESEELLKRINSILDSKKIDAIIFQDYNKGVLSQKVIQQVILESISRKIPTVVDPKFNNFWSYKHTTLFKPNLKEIRSRVPFEIKSTKASLKKAADYVRSRIANQYTLITLSEKGLYIGDESMDLLIPTHERKIADVCGAGDTVISLVALGLALQLESEEIASLANLAGGQVCEKVGVVPVDKTQLLNEFISTMS
ncbi:MAG: carbohydrate kinase [Bacteroidetes bacterium]|nr:carbohydrate kinase [Bacteroidota bacterium]